MAARVTSVFMYVKDVRRSLEFYNEIVGAEIVQIHAEQERAPYSLAILRHRRLHADAPSPGAARRRSSRIPGSGSGSTSSSGSTTWTPSISIASTGAILSVSGEPADQSWGWREFALRDPDGYVWSIYQDKSGGQWTV